MTTAPSALSEMDPAFVVNRQGRDFVLYAGLLDLATRHGLASIETRIEQAPCEANNQTTIVHARVTFANGRRFDGIGDANAQNVGRNIAPHATRMAETRAKARALRDALNINGVAMEELGEEEELAPAAAPARQASPARPQQHQLKPHTTQVAPSPATMLRITRLWALLGKQGDPPPAKDQSAAESLRDGLEALAVQTMASEEQWSNYMSAAARLTAAGIPDAEVTVGDTMSVRDYEQIIIKMNALKKQLPAAAGGRA